MLYRRVLLPMVDHFKQRDIAYGLIEYNSKKAERALLGLQPPRGMEHEGVYFDDAWEEGEKYTECVPPSLASLSTICTALKYWLRFVL
jgi:hypothetical protein